MLPFVPIPQLPEAPEGFVVERALADSHSFLAVCALEDGLCLSTEDAGLLIVRDGDGDGVFEAAEPLAGPREVQGLSQVGEDLWAVGRLGGQLGLYRGDLSGENWDLRLAFEGDDEHGPHAVVPAEDGTLLVAVGDAAWAKKELLGLWPEPPTPGPPPLPDPGGFGRNSRWPYGHVGRFDPKDDSWTLVVAGLRNTYDLVEADGEWFTVDSDMEWDVGLPWYRGARVLPLVAGADYGSRPGSGTFPGDGPEVMRLGRSSPTGVVRPPASWPERYRSTFLVGDWIQARVTAVHVREGEDGWLSASEPLLKSASAWNVTDLCVLGDRLYVVSGGRGTRGDVYSMRWVGTEVHAPDIELEQHFPPDLRDLSEHSVDQLCAEWRELSNPVECIRYANEMRHRDEGWSKTTLKLASLALDEASTYVGGGNLQGYVRAMTHAWLDRIPLEQLERPDTLILAALFTRDEDPVRWAAPFQEAFDALDGPPVELVQARRALLQSLAGSNVKSLAPWLRELHASDPSLSAETLTLLASVAEEADFSRLAAGLSHGRRDVRDACARGLLRLETRTSEVTTIRAALDAARQHGPRGGHWAIKVLCHWTGRPATGLDWSADLEDWERWFRLEYPDWIPPDEGPAAGSTWDREQIATFLAASVARPGHAARGAEVFRRATCDRCHTLGTVGSGWAPDLWGVTERFDPRALLAALMNPSEEIADRYGTTVVTTWDGDRFDGRVVGEREDAIELLLASGVRQRIPLETVASRGASRISAMPEGLLDELTLEEVKDLVAYLAVNGEVDSKPLLPVLDLTADAQRGRWRGAFAGWKLSGTTLSGVAPETNPKGPLVFLGTPNTLTLELDAWASGAAAIVVGGQRIELAATEGWAHYRVNLTAGAGSVERDGHVTLEWKRSDTSDQIEFELPQSGELYVSRLRLRAE